MSQESSVFGTVGRLLAGTLFAGIAIGGIEAIAPIFPSETTQAQDEAPQPAIAPTPQPIPSMLELERALQQRQWQHASEMTWARLGRGAVLPDGRAFRQFPCAELAEIDALWRRSSGDRYGLSVQRNLWTLLARKYPQRDRAYTEFRETVGWTDSTRPYPVGHFPNQAFWSTGEILRFGCGDAACSFPRTEVEETRLALEFVVPRLLECRIP
ncbi:GUN4 domain-containing protein [Baaleninema simplex]|uniref:GUN4 domain-containing protein n=1 Tax=Baaleninema simplex TaxID=2862350 RepID=UPI00034C83A0|nr:GUN4 domain-containing protein [Baaleninema simplex]